jgi:primosomal protein N'
MTDLLTPALAIAAVRFKWQKGEDQKTYDYFVPHGMELAPGDKVMVETKRGETEVSVVEIKAVSEMASKPILRRADPVLTEVQTDQQPKQGLDF